jgi:hypothetical protein
MGADGNSQLVAMWDAAASAITSTFDAYGWIVPAILVALLYLCLIALFCWLVEDLPFELPVFEGVGGIFKWMRKSWQGDNCGLTREERSRLTLLKLG